MRVHTVVLAAVCAVVCDASLQRPEADVHPPPNDYFVVGLLAPKDPGDTNCPMATRAIFSCAFAPASHYVVFDQRKMKGKLATCQYATVYGDLDLNVCPGYRVIRVKRVGKPLVPPVPCDYKECPPEP